MFPDESSPDHAAPIYKKSQPLNITFTVSKYPSESLGEFLRKLRLEKGLSQKQLAEKIRVNEMTVVGWEKNHRIPMKINLLELAKFFKVKEKILFNIMPAKTNG